MLLVVGWALFSAMSEHGINKMNSQAMRCLMKQILAIVF